MNKKKWVEITPPSARKATKLEKFFCWFFLHEYGLPPENDYQWCSRCNRRWRKIK
jgi:hypothetical protein